MTRLDGKARLQCSVTRLDLGRVKNKKLDQNYPILARLGLDKFLALGAHWGGPTYIVTGKNDFNPGGRKWNNFEFDFYNARVFFYPKNFFGFT
jgi:hypothetical protein